MNSCIVVSLCNVEITRISSAEYSAVNWILLLRRYLFNTCASLNPSIRGIGRESEDSDGEATRPIREAGRVGLGGALWLMQRHEQSLAWVGTTSGGARSGSSFSIRGQLSVLRHCHASATMPPATVPRYFPSKTCGRIFEECVNFDL